MDKITREHVVMLDELIAEGGCSHSQVLAISKFMEGIEEAVYSLNLSVLGLKSLASQGEDIERGVKSVSYMATEILNGVKAHKKAIEHLLSKH